MCSLTVVLRSDWRFLVMIVDFVASRLFLILCVCYVNPRAQVFGESTFRELGGRRGFML